MVILWQEAVQNIAHQVAATRPPEWWEIISGILAIPATLLGLAYSYVLIQKTRYEIPKTKAETEKLELEIQAQRKELSPVATAQADALLRVTIQPALCASTEKVLTRPRKKSPRTVTKLPNPILQNCPGPAPSPPSTGTEQDLEGLASFSHVADMAGVTMLGAGLMVGSPIAAGATCFYSGGLLCFAAIEAAPAGTVGGYYLMKSGAQQLTAMLPSKNGC